MAIVIFSVHHEDGTYSPMAVIKDDGGIICKNPRLTALLKRLGSNDRVETALNNGQSKVTGRFPEERALELLKQAEVSNGER